MKYFLICSVDPPVDGEWSEDCEFRFGTKEDIDREFEALIVEGEYPLIVKGVVDAVASARIEVTYP